MEKNGKKKQNGKNRTEKTETLHQKILCQSMEKNGKKKQNGKKKTERKKQKLPTPSIPLKINLSSRPDE